MSIKVLLKFVFFCVSVRDTHQNMDKYVTNSNILLVRTHRILSRILSNKVLTHCRTKYRDGTKQITNTLCVVFIKNLNSLPIIRFFKTN